MSLKPVLLIFVVLALGAALRIPGVSWGDRHLGNQVFARWHVDEETHVRVAKQFLSGKVDYGFGYVKGFGLHIAVLAFFEELCGQKVSPDDLYRLGRWISVAYGLGIVLLVYLAVFGISGRRFPSMLAAGFMALCSLAVTNSHFAVSDAASAFWIWTTAYLSWQGIHRQSGPAKLGAWAACGVALGVKISVAALAPVCVLLLFSSKRGKDLISGLSLTFLAFMVINGWGIGIDGLLAIWRDIFGNNLAVIPRHSVFETIFIVMISLFPAFSIPLVLLAVIGLVEILRKKRDQHRIALACFLSPVLVHALVLCLLDDPFERHLLPFAPAVCGLAALAWEEMIPKGTGAGLFWSLPLFSYLCFFAVAGEYPFWSDNRITARSWIMKEIEPGARILEGPYAWLSLPTGQYPTEKIRLRSRKFPKPGNFDFLILHEAHTFRYERSRLSPFQRPDPDNIYHPDAFGRMYWEKLHRGGGPFRLKRRFAAPGQWSLERRIYKKYWGTFTSFVGEVYLFERKKNDNRSRLPVNGFKKNE